MGLRHNGAAAKAANISPLFPASLRLMIKSKTCGKALSIWWVSFVKRLSLASAPCETARCTNVLEHSAGKTLSSSPCSRQQGHLQKGTIWERFGNEQWPDVYEIPIFMNSVRLCHYDSNDDCYEKCYEHSLSNWKPTSMQKLLLMQGELQGNNCAAEHDRMSLILGISLTSTEGCSKLHDYHHLPIFAASCRCLALRVPLVVLPE